MALGEIPNPCDGLRKPRFVSTLAFCSDLLLIQFKGEKGGGGKKKTLCGDAVEEYAGTQGESPSWRLDVKPEAPPGVFSCVTQSWKLGVQVILST